MADTTAQQKTMRELRQAKGWTREKLAVELGVTLSSVANIETGRHRPRLERAQRIAELFGVRVDEINWETRPKEPTQSKADADGPKQGRPAAA